MYYDDGGSIKDDSDGNGDCDCDDRNDSFSLRFVVVVVAGYRMDQWNIKKKKTSKFIQHLFFSQIFAICF